MAVCLIEAYIVWHKQFKSIDFFFKTTKIQERVLHASCYVYCVVS